MKLLIFVPKITERVKYIFSFIGIDILGLDVDFSTNPEEFIQCTTAKFSYSEHAISNELHFKSQNLLFEENIQEQNYQTIINDPFAFSFLLISRYEEYLPYKKDSHGRFSYANSKTKNLYDIKHPFIDDFAFDLLKQLKTFFPNLKNNSRKYRWINTIDVDHAWIYKHKSLINTFLSLSKKILKTQFSAFFKQISIFLGIKKDPYFIYDSLEKEKFKTLYFIPIGKKSNCDNNFQDSSQPYRTLICKLSKTQNIGLHPSYRSNKNIKILNSEKKTLDNLVNFKITKSRQHYIKLHIPETYQNLISVDIAEDYSMGYPDQIGFRAGTCTPFYWFDLKKNKKTNLKIFSFCFMDVTLKNYLKLTPERAFSEIKKLIENIKKVNGTAISIFHNDSLSDFGEWKTWRIVFEKTTELNSNDSIN